MQPFNETNWPYPLPEPKTSMQAFANYMLVQTGNPYAFHPEGSPYLGLPLEKQKVLARIRRGGTRTKKSVLKRMKAATSVEYNAILLQCVEALICAWQDNTKRLDRIHVMMKIPFNFRTLYKQYWFPRCTILAHYDWSVFVSVKIDSMINYLYELGKCPFTAKELRKNLWAVLQSEKEMAWYYEYAACISIVEKYATTIDGASRGDIAPKRKDKGRGNFSKYRKRRNDK